MNKFRFPPALQQQAHRPLARIVTTLAALAGLCTSALAQDKTPFTPEKGKEFLQKASDEARIAQKERTKTFEEFKKSVFKEPIPGGKYIVNGDTPISNDKQLLEFYKQNIENPPPPPGAEFAIMNKLGIDIVWKPEEKKAIKYCISSAAAESGGFGNRYNSVVSAMADATRAWEEAADIDFIHVTQEDVNCTASNNNVVFDVRPVNFNAYLARAFFPDDARADRNVLIDNSSLELRIGGKLSLTGILRHELGHTVGARHEHTRPQSGTCFEDMDWRGVTDYDAFSVMHYPQCNGKGDWSLTLTNLDKIGVACVYKAAPGFTFDQKLCPPPKPK